MRNVFQSTTVTEAGLVRSLLIENGIDARLVESVSHHPATANSEVWITRDEDHDRALELVRNMYDAPSREAEAWSCPKCRERNPASFDLCWSCGTDREARGEDA
jgi:hypothetical protein